MPLINRTITEIRHLKMIVFSERCHFDFLLAHEDLWHRYQDRKTVKHWMQYKLICVTRCFKKTHTSAARLGFCLWIFLVRTAFLNINSYVLWRINWIYSVILVLWKILKQLTSKYPKSHWKERSSLVYMTIMGATKGSKKAKLSPLKFLTTAFYVTSKVYERPCL